MGSLDRKSHQVLSKFERHLCLRVAVVTCVKFVDVTAYYLSSDLQGPIKINCSSLFLR